MKNVCATTTIVLLAVLLLPCISQAAVLWVSDADFSGGNFNRTTAADVQSGNLTLSIGPDGKYYSDGYFTSRVFDAGLIAPWRSAMWSQYKNAAAHNTSIQLRFSNDSSLWTGWSALSPDNMATALSSYARYAQYRMYLSTALNETTPAIEHVNISYEIADPVVSLDYPSDSFKSYDGNTTFNCSATDIVGLKNITLYWNYNGLWGPAGSAEASGFSNSSIFLKTGLMDGSYKWACLASNNMSVSAFSTNRTFSVNRSVVKINYTIPESVIEGSDISLLVDATSIYAMDSVWASIRLPNSSIENVSIQNRVAYLYRATTPGLYAVSIFANDTRRNLAAVTANFSVLTLMTFAISPSAPLLQSSSVKTIFYLTRTGTKMYEYNVATDNKLPVDILNDTYNIQFNSFYNTFQVKLNGIGAESNKNRNIVLDYIENTEGFTDVYAVGTDYSYTSAEVKIFYNGSKFRNDNYTGVYKCHLWSMAERVCYGQWVRLSPEINRDEGSIKMTLMNLSAFGLRQEGFCGDNICSAEENSENCMQDCECTTGETRVCGSSSTGVCKFGVQTCIDGHWAGCSGNTEPSADICNGRDDNCDGVIDNVNNGTSIEVAQCQCFNNGVPKIEECNNIDDDCDGQVDEGVERQCGTDRGICDFGKSVCVSGRWSECMGEIRPEKEVCGNGEDDNCNGEIDENCPKCDNGEMDGDEEGIDCGGTCEKGCFEVPWAVLVVIGIIGLALVLVYEAGKKIRAKKEDRWDKLEDRYAGSSRGIE
jgi:hypothetical protein